LLAAVELGCGRFSGLLGRSGVARLPPGFIDPRPALVRRFIASPRREGCADEIAMRQLQQGFATSEMGFNDQFALQKF
jgi:hypothetical protein